MPRQSERVGRSGEYLVASLLSLHADTVMIVPHSAEADIIFDVDHTLYKCQVKTQSKIQNCRECHGYMILDVVLILKKDSIQKML